MRTSASPSALLLALALIASTAVLASAAAGRDEPLVAAARPTAPAPAVEASRGYTHKPSHSPYKYKGSYGYKKDKECLGAYIDTDGTIISPFSLDRYDEPVAEVCDNKKNQCCPPFACRNDDKVTVKVLDLDGDLITTTTEKLDDSTYDAGTCCISAPNYDITSLIIDEDGDSLIDGSFDISKLTSTVPIEVLWRLACLCCTGKIQSSQEGTYSDKGPIKFICNPTATQPPYAPGTGIFDPTCGFCDESPPMVPQLCYPDAVAPYMKQQEMTNSYGAGR